jgi:hypothetical protein
MVNEQCLRQIMRQFHAVETQMRILKMRIERLDGRIKRDVKTTRRDPRAWALEEDDVYYE